MKKEANVEQVNVYGKTMEDTEEPAKGVCNNDVHGQMQASSRSIDDNTMRTWAEDRSSWTKSIR